MNQVEIPEEFVGADCDEYVELSAEDIINLPREVAIRVVDYILTQWYEACHREEKA